MKILIPVFAFFCFFAACKTDNKTQSNPNLHKVEVLEFVHTPQYTYLRVKEEDKERWLAVPRYDTKVGTTVYYMGGYDMGKFHSKELNRDFDNVLFLDSVSLQPIDLQKTSSTTNNTDSVVQEKSTGKAKLDKIDVNIQPDKDGVTIAQLFEKRDSYNGKIIKVKGVVLKYNEAIMDRNWIHIQDGTQDAKGNFDLTVTTSEVVKEGDVISFEGKIVLNQDFGYGYSYDVLMENAKIIKK